MGANWYKFRKGEKLWLWDLRIFHKEGKNYSWRMNRICCPSREDKGITSEGKNVDRLQKWESRTEEQLNGSREFGSENERQSWKVRWEPVLERLKILKYLPEVSWTFAIPKSVLSLSCSITLASRACAHAVTWTWWIQASKKPLITKVSPPPVWQGT